jgi:hypothetical protein
MKKIYHVTVTEAERQELQEILERRSEKSLPVKHVYILLAADEHGPQNWDDRRIRETSHVSRSMVERTRKRFVEDSLHVAVWGKKRDVFKERILTGEVEAKLVALRCSHPPIRLCHMESATAGRSDGGIGVCRAHEPRECSSDVTKNELKPWRVKSWIIPEAGPDFVCAMEEVLDVYAQPYDPAHPKVCLDESPRQLIGERRAPFTDEHGIVHEDYEYTREGTADIFMVVEPLGGRREVFIRDQHTRLDWAEVVAYIVEEMYAEAEDMTLIQDNLSAHKKSALYELFSPERARAILKKLKFVFTPKPGSWLNIAEIELSVLARQGLTSRVDSKEALIRQCTVWYETRNDKGSTVDWQFTTNAARIKLKRLYPSL